MKKLSNGAYTLPGDTLDEIDNPAVDRRKRGDWRFAETFKPGTYFVTTHEHTGDYPYTEINIHKGRASFGITIGKRNFDDFAPLLDALVPDDSLDSALRYAKREHYVDPIDVLVRLVEAGVVSDDAVRVAVHAQREADIVDDE